MSQNDLPSDNRTEEIMRPAFSNRSLPSGLVARCFLLMPFLLMPSCTTFDKISAQAVDKRTLTHDFGYVGCKARNPNDPAIKEISEMRTPRGVTYMVIHTAYCGLEPNVSEAWYESANNRLYVQYRYQMPGGVLDPKSATCMCDYWTAFEFDDPIPEIRDIFLFGESVSLSD